MTGRFWKPGLRRLAVILAALWPSWAGVASDGSGITLTTPTFATLDPALLHTVGVDGAPYSAHVPASSPAPAATGDLVERFAAPDTKPVTVVVKAPVTSIDVAVAPIIAGEDPAQYFAGAIAAAKPGTRLIFPAGQVYDFVGGCGSVGTHLVISAPRDLVIDGNGSVLDFTGVCDGIDVIGATRVVFENFTIDWPTLQIASVGTVIATGGNGTSGYTYDLKLEPQFVAGAPLQIEAATAWDTINNYWSLDDPQDDVSYGPPLPLSPTGTTRGIPSYGVAFPVGEKLLVRHYAGEGVGIVTWGGRDVTYDHITMLSSPGVGFFFPSGRGLRIAHSAITRAPGRPISTASDAVHLSGAVVGDIVIEDSTFAYQGDDGLNINAEMAPLARHDVGGTSLAVPSWTDAFVGETVGLFGPTIGFAGVDRVTAIATNGETGVSTLTLQAPLPKDVGAGFAANLGAPAARYVVRRNNYLHNRARGVLLQAAYGLLQDNTFDGQSLFSIYLVTSAYWHEGPGAQDLLAIGNTVTNPGKGGGLAAVTIAREDATVTPVYVGRAVPAPNAPVPAIHQNVIFAGNTISQVPGAAVYVSSANNILFYGNTIADTVEAPVPNTINTAPDIAHPVVINDATNIVLLKNSIAPGTGGEAAVAVDADTTGGIVVGP